MQHLSQQAFSRPRVVGVVVLSIEVMGLSQGAREMSRMFRTTRLQASPSALVAYPHRG
jgi:hypothetical protein